MGCSPDTVFQLVWVAALTLSFSWCGLHSYLHSASSILSPQVESQLCCHPGPRQVYCTPCTESIWSSHSLLCNAEVMPSAESLRLHSCTAVYECTATYRFASRMNENSQINIVLFSLKRWPLMLIGIYVTISELI